IYTAAFDELAGPGSEELTRWYLKLSKLLQEHQNAMNLDKLSDGLRIMAYLLQASRDDPDKTQIWLRILHLNLNEFPDPDSLRRAKALQWGDKDRPNVVEPLRNTIEDILALPSSIELQALSLES